MKALTTAIATTLLIASVGASANTMRTTSDIVTTNVMSSKESAYQAGLDTLNELKSTPSNVLEYTVEAPLGSVESGTLKVTDDNFITVEERMAANGQVGYIGVVKVGLSFEEHESDK